MEPTISIIVPIYKVEPYLRRCLDSVLAQTLPNWECILVNDGSPDNSPAIAREYASRDPRFVMLDQDNQGLSAARNHGIDASTGEYLTFLDSDDALAPQFLERLYQALTSQDADLAVCRYIRFCDTLPDHSEPPGEVTRWTAEEAVSMALVQRERYTITAWGKLYKRRLFRELRYPVGKLHEDEFTTYKAYAACRQIAVIPDRLYDYYTRPDSIMGSYSLRRLHILEAFTESLDFVRTSCPALYGPVYVNYLFNLAIAWFRAGTLEEPQAPQQAIREAFIRGWPEYRQHYRREATFVKAAALRIFRCCPPLFRLGASLYLRLVPQD